MCRGPIGGTHTPICCKLDVDMRTQGHIVGLCSREFQCPAMPAFSGMSHVTHETPNEFRLGGGGLYRRILGGGA